MSCQQQLYIQLFHLCQAVQIVLQRIVGSKLDGDVRCYGSQDMVATEQYLLLFIVKAHVTRRVTRRFYGFQSVSTILQHVSFIYISEVYLGIMNVFSPRMDIGVPAELSLWESEFQKHIIQYPPIEISSLEVHQLSVGLT